MINVGGQNSGAAFKPTQSSLSRNLISSRIVKPLISFVDDDVVKEVKTRLEPIFNAKGIKGSLAVITGSLGAANGRLEVEDIKRMYANGWEMLGHTVDHVNLSNYANDDAGLDYQIRVCKDQVASLGIPMKGFVYPQGYSDIRVRRVTSQYADFAFGTEGGSFRDGDLMDTFNIQRIAFGSWMTENPTVNGNSEKTTLDYYKACVDYAQANNMWLIFMTHIVAQDISYDTMLGDLIDYIKSKNIDIVNASEGFKMHGNRLYAGDPDAGYVAVDKNGNFRALMAPKKTANNLYTSANLITDFEANRTTITVIRATNASSFPESIAGTLFTHYPDSTYHRYNYQEYVTSSGNTYMRRCTDDTGTAWTPWVNATTEKLYPSNTYSANTPLSSFGLGISNLYVFGANVTGTPNNIAGILTTYYNKSNGNDHQIFKEYGTNNIYRRTTDSGGVLGEWEYINPVKLTKVLFSDLPSAIPIGIYYRFVAGSDTDLGSAPESATGTLVTVKPHTSYGIYQEYHIRLSQKKYKRYWDDAAGKWSRFNLVTTAPITTANRPPRPYQGMSYFDTTLGKPVWCKTAAVIDTATDTITTPAVWVDATGTTVI